MLIVMLVLLVLGTAATMTFERHDVIERETRLELARLQALQAAEGALEIARYHRARDESLPTSVTVGDCECSFEVLGAAAGRPNRVLRVRAFQPAHATSPQVSEVLEVAWD